MRAAIYADFRAPLAIERVADPEPPEGGVVIRVEATGLCRSDWHGWMGHDPDITPPHVPGHELAGTIAALGSGVTGWHIGDRVTVPFVCGCGVCGWCREGNHQVCPWQTQPGFTHWGSFAEYTAIHAAMTNLVLLPEDLDYTAAANLGCRFTTAFRAIVHQGRVQPGEWVAIHGCGGVGLSAVHIAAACGARVIAIDIRDEARKRARELGADYDIDASDSQDVVGEVCAHTGGGAHLSVDALGSPVTCHHSIANLRRRGRHVQVGLLAGKGRETHLPMDLIVGRELTVLGSHGMPAHDFPLLLQLIQAGRLQPEKLVGDRVGLEEGARRLQQMDQFLYDGVTVIEPFVRS